MKKWIIVLIGLLGVLLLAVGCKTIGKAYIPPDGWVSDDTEDSASCSGNCHSSYYRGYDEDWGSVAADNGGCNKPQKDKRCTPNGIGTEIIEYYEWINEFNSKDVVLEDKYEIKNGNIGQWKVYCYGYGSSNLTPGWRLLSLDSTVGIKTVNLAISPDCLQSGNPLQIKNFIAGGPSRAPTFYYESRIWYNLCAPASCASLGKQCGSWSDGCGGTLNCGTCQSGYYCSSNGQCIQNETGRGSIYATSNPSGAGAGVKLDAGPGLYSTPKTFSNVSVGVHTLFYSGGCYYPYNTTATVYAGQTTNVNAVLTQKPYSCKGAAWSCSVFSGNVTGNSTIYCGTSCTSQQGCSCANNSIDCVGTALACSSFTNGSLCINQKPCYWSC